MAAKNPLQTDARTTVRITPTQHALITRLVDAGRFRSRSAVYRAAARAAAYQDGREIALDTLPLDTQGCSTRDSFRLAAGVRADLDDDPRYESLADAVRAGLRQLLARHHDATTEGSLDE